MLLANKEKVPVVPMGGGLALSGLVIPQKGGIVIDMKRMRRILQVNEKARSVIVEGGTSQGALQAFLEQNYPLLEHSLPEAPPPTTIASNVMIHGQGRFTLSHGFNSDMVTGLEVVLPSGEISKIGSCAMSSDWFSKGPTLPDLSGLFLGWFGATGIITKVGIKLYPRKKIKDIESFTTDKVDLMPEVLFRLTHTGMAEDLSGGSQMGWLFDPPMIEGYHYVSIRLAGDTDEEIEFKRKMIWDSLKDIRKSKDGGFLWIMNFMKPPLMESPQRWVTRIFGDKAFGGAATYTGTIALIEKYPALYAKLREIAKKHNVPCAGMFRVVDNGQSMMYGPGYPFDRTDKDNLQRVRAAVNEMHVAALDLGAIPWKPSVEEQEIAMKRMDPGNLKLMKMIKHNLDPNGIMNPGNWEVE
jgi:glycolate oxidase